MVTEEWILPDGRVINQIFHQGDINQDIEYKIRPYYSHTIEGWTYPIWNGSYVSYMANGPDEYITHKLTTIEISR